MNAPLQAPARPITIAILAMGGEGGGVLADWIADVAEHGGYVAQTTSVPGVAQRTGATIYYIEIFPRAAAQAAGRDPVLALMPVPGDVDVVIASELMEAGRAVQRGLVTPDRTTLLASTHRVYSMTEKVAMADGRVDRAALLEGCRAAAARLHAFDMAAVAQATNSVVSAVLFGVLAGSAALPFQRAAFEGAVRRGGVGVTTSLAAFAAGYEATSTGSAERPETAALVPPVKPLAALVSEVEQTFTGEALAVARAGVERLVDYQDVDYARTYLSRLEPLRALEAASGDGSGRLLAETARQLALGMSYEDTIRVAELKIRPSRFARVRDEVRVGQTQILEIVEFMHPRVEEIADTLPAGLGRWLLRTGWARNTLGRFTRSGRVMRTTSIRGFLSLYAVAALKPLRPRSLRYEHEQAFLEGWLDAVRRAAERDYALGIEVAECRNLVKGYGETYARGRARYETLMGALPWLTAAPGAAEELARLRAAANADETGEALAAALNALSDRRLPHASLPAA